MRRVLGTVAAVVVLGLRGSANATVLYTPALLTDTGVTYVRCVITNIGSKALPVTVEVLDGTGSVTSSSGELTLAPGATAPNTLGLNGMNVCKFTVASKNKVRAHACVSKFAAYTCDMQADAR